MIATRLFSGPAALRAVCFFLLMAALPGRSETASAAEGTNGVSPNTISRPSGPGSLEGLGASFQPALNTGTANYVVSIDMPPGVAGFTPSLSLRYDGGQGFGVAGIGWEFGPSSIRRQVEKGLPRYGLAPDGEDIPDRFLGMDGEELVRLQNGYYLARVEKLHIRYRSVGDHWEAHTKSGIKLEFGVTPQGRLANADGSKVFAWSLERQTDTHGNVIEYTYVQPVADDRQIYLDEVRYGPGGPPWAHAYAARMTYEDRPDPFTDYRSGFKVRTSKRLAQIDVLYNDQLIRRYTFGYESHPHWSLLTTVTMYGADGVSALPSTVFAYSQFDSGDGLSPISAAGQILTSQGEPPEALNSEDVGLIDLNADGLADLLATGTGHVAYLNRGVQDAGDGPTIVWEGPVDVAALESRVQAFELSSQQVHLADMTGDGISDLVVTDAGNYVEYFENTGQTGWRAGRLMSTEQSPPPAPFGAQGASVKTADMGFNKRIDIVQSQFGALFTWFNQGDGRYTGPIVTDAPFDGSSPVEFSDTGVFLVDMNGDRLLDIALIKPNGVTWWPHLGYARFGPRVDMLLPDRALDEGPGENLHRARLEDITGDGRSDLVVERAHGSDLWFWQNMGGGEFAASRVVTDLPVTPDAEATWADINGNGTTDLIYSDSSLPDSRIQAVDLGVLIGQSPHFNLLTSIDHSYGRKIDIDYRTTTEFMVDAFVAGHPWATTVPFPAYVVSETRTSIGLDLDGYADEGPNGDVYITQFVYRDGYYDPTDHQFRGFSFVKQIELGDQRFGGSDAPTLVKRFGFHTGAPDGIDNNGDGTVDEPGDLWTGREEEPLKGVQLWQENTSLPDDAVDDGAFAADARAYDRTITLFTIRDLCRSDGGTLVDLIGDTGYRTADAYNRHVRHAVQMQTEQSIIETGNGPAKLLRSFSDIDALGNPVFVQTLGDLTDPTDDLYTAYEYALNVPDWIVDRTSRVIITDGTSDGAFVSETRHYYDGNPFVGMPIGQIGSRGVLHRSEMLLSKDPVPPMTERSSAIGDPRYPASTIDTIRRQIDAYGNPIVLRSANGYDRTLEYDPELHIYPTTERIILGGGSDDLVITATYDHRFGVILNHTNVNGHVVQLTYDTFGRLIMEQLPGDNQPTHTYAYNLGAPVSAITTTANDNVGGMPSLVSTVFFDSLGRLLGTYLQGGPVMQDVTVYNTRGLPRKTYQPFAGGSEIWSPPAENARSPAPVIIRQPISSSAFIDTTASCNSRFSFRFMALRTSGRFSVIMATPSSFSRRICS
ncbi:MAG: VCBS repeat-containing protein [Planctomycetes bacterium]|nr:VCBS repeat-containing protein [Planctomycetota bacterium]